MKLYLVFGRRWRMISGSTTASCGCVWSRRTWRAWRSTRRGSTWATCTRFLPACSPPGPGTPYRPALTGRGSLQPRYGSYDWLGHILVVTAAEVGLVSLVRLTRPNKNICLVPVTRPENIGRVNRDFFFFTDAEWGVIYRHYFNV